jgi:hypothetical protein
MRCLPVILVLAITAATVCLAADRFTVSPWPDKVLYDPGETATFQVTVKNASGQAFTGKLGVRVLWEMEDTKALAEAPLTLADGETKSVTAQWPNLPEVLGCEVRADLLDASGKPVATGSEYFNVCRAKDSCRVGIHAVTLGLITTSDPAYLATIPNAILWARQSYVNIGEHFLSKSAVLDLAPDVDECMGGDYWNSVTAIRTAIEESHKYGMKNVVYTTSYSTHGLADLDIPMQHPEWLAYNEYGQPEGASVNILQEDKERMPIFRQLVQPGPFNSANFNWLNQKLLDWHIDSLIANHKLVGMDGVRYDGHPGAIWGKYDINGKPLPTGEERVKETVRIVRYIRQRIDAADPNYIWMFNAGTAVGGNNPVDLDKGVLEPTLVPVVENGGAMCDEEQRGAYSAYNRFHAWKAFADVMVSDVDLTRANGGYAYCLFPWASTVHRNSDEIGYGIMLAAGDHPWFSAPHDEYATNPGGSHFPVQKELFAFATRFSALLWGPGLNRVRQPEKLVQVSSDKGEIWWKNFVHQRTLADGRKYLIVHLLNAPPNQEMGVTEQPLPDPLANVRIAYQVPVKKVWLCTARPGPAHTVSRKGQKLFHYSQAETYEAMGPLQCAPAKVEGGKVTLPELRMWTMVVAEL